MAFPPFIAMTNVNTFLYGNVPCVYCTLNASPALIPVVGAVTENQFNADNNLLPPVIRRGTDCSNADYDVAVSNATSVGLQSPPFVNALSADVIVPDGNTDPINVVANLTQDCTIIMEIMLNFVAGVGDLQTVLDVVATGGDGAFSVNGFWFETSQAAANEFGILTNRTISTALGAQSCRVFVYASYTFSTLPDDLKVTLSPLGGDVTAKRGSMIQTQIILG